MTFKKLVSFEVEYAPQYSFTKFVSNRTKLQFVHVGNKSSPLVQGFFAFGTECSDDSGVPHTLEHLVFMGSQKYPYKGLLDTAGNLCMSNTNAWTATDQTVYTLSTAGWEGFKKLLPVYLDHLFNPTLTDEACTTEVYHIDPDDLSDKGVVFSEMEGIESQSWFITALERQRLMFPEGSGYRSETGGLTSNLRVLTNDEIRAFHKKMYTPDNCCIIITGNISVEEALKQVEQYDSQLPDFTEPQRKRPFLDSPASVIPNSISELRERTVEFPEFDESRGEILFSWISAAYLNHVEDEAVSILLEYLTDSALAPLTKELVETENPLATEAEYYTDDFMRTISNISLRGVPTERLQEAKEKLLDVIGNHEISLDRVRLVTKNMKWDFVSKFEKNGDHILSQTAITDFLYGDLEGKCVESSVKTLADFDALMKWPQDKWQALLTEKFVVNKPVIVLGKPSASLNEKLEAEGEKRLQKRRNTFDDAKRAELRQLLDRANQRNNAQIPDDLLNSFRIKDPQDSVTFIETKSVTSIPVPSNDNDDILTKRLLDSKPKDLPLFMHFEQFPSNFLEIHVALNADFVDDPTLLPYYHVLAELFSMPMLDESGEIIPYEDVVSQLKGDVIESRISLGISGSFSNLIDFKIKCKADNYEKAVMWLKRVLFGSIFDESRVSILLENFYHSIVETKREGDQMLYSSMNRSLYDTNTAKKSTDEIFVEPIIEGILSDIEEGKYKEKVLPKLKLLRSQLTDHINKGHILIFGNIEKLKTVYEPWTKYFSANINHLKDSEVELPPTPLLTSHLSDWGKNPTKKAHIVSTPASESSYMLAVSPLPKDFSYLHPDFPAVYLAAVYLECVEGPFWKGIRGSGLAYGAYVTKMFESNMVGFNVYRASDIVSCFEAGKQIVEEFASGSREFDPVLITAAISSVINTIASRESNYFSAAVNKYLNTFCKRRGPHFNSELLKRLEAVTAEHLQEALQRIYSNIFNPEQGSVFIACHPSKLEAIKEYFSCLKFEVNVEELFDDETDGEVDTESEEEE